MLGLLFGDWIILVLFCIFAGGILNNWIFKKFPNHTVQKLTATFIVLICIAGLNLMTNGNSIHKALTIYLAIMYGSTVLGVVLDNAWDKHLKLKLKG